MTAKSPPAFHIQDPSEVNAHLPVRIANVECTLTKSGEGNLWLVDNQVELGSSQFEVWQRQVCSDPEQVAKAFFEFWAGYWLRDDEYALTSLDAWSQFCGFLQAAPEIADNFEDSAHSLDEWLLAIKRTKPGTARGICGFSQPEMLSMSTSLLSRIVDIFNMSSTHGLPSWLMLAKVALLAKTNDSSAIQNTRPITIFSLLFRTWAKVSAHRLLMNWARVIPSNVAGALPGRSSTTLTLKSALHIEHSLQIHSALGGFSLDISKCFNGFGRLPIQMLLQRLGLGKKQSAFWIKSLAGMSRTVLLLGSYSQPQVASTGCAEGDPMAVTAMVAIGFNWHSLMTSLGLRATAFADDWSWTSGNFPLHVEALKLTHEFLKALRLTSDPRKCWCWSTTASGRAAWSKVNLQVMGNPRHYKIALAERELGVFLHYSRSIQTGCQIDRISDGLNRLTRLGHLPLSITAKAKLIQSNIWPSVFFRCEGVYIGKAHFDKLRSRASRVLVSKTPATSPELSLTLLSCYVEDPVVYALKHSLMIWRRMMLEGDDLPVHFREILRAAKLDPMRAYGPASALKCYLQKIEWLVDDEGYICSHRGMRVLLHCLSKRDLSNLLHETWDQAISAKISERKDFAEWPVIDSLYTDLIPRPSDAREEGMLAVLLSLGTIYNGQADHWADSEDVTSCPLCDAANERVHFPLNCAGVSDVLWEFSSLLGKVKGLCPHMFFLPAIYRHPRMTMMETICDAREFPDPFNLSELGWDGVSLPRFYTDGSCPYPKLPRGHIACYSIIWDSLVSDDDRRSVAGQYRDLGTFPPCLIPVQAALPVGSQTNNRAELSAVIQLVRSQPAAIVICDSQYTIDLFMSVSVAPIPFLHQDKQNF